MLLETRCKNKVQDIFTEISNAADVQASLFGGNAGFLLFLQNYSVFFGDDVSGKMGNMIEQIMETHIPGFSFCGGEAGIHWSYNYLHRSGCLDQEDRDLLCCRDRQFEAKAIGYLEEDNYDFLHGALGIAWYFLYQETFNEDFFTAVFTHLERMADNEGQMFYGYAFDKRMTEKETVDFGLAHGIPSVLKFCIQCYRKSVCREQARSMAHRIIRYLLQHVNEEPVTSIFPSKTGKGRSGKIFSRLSWCYGDLSVAYILYQAALVFEDGALQEFALNVVRRSSGRRLPEHTFIYDAGVCHGSAGVAHIYNRIWQRTGDSVIKEATDYWIQRTLDFALHDDGIAGYKRYNPETKQWSSDFGLLEGATGIGLVLLSYISNTFDWDYSLMLND